MSLVSGTGFIRPGAGSYLSSPSPGKQDSSKERSNLAIASLVFIRANRMPGEGERKVRDDRKRKKEKLHTGKHFDSQRTHP